MKIEAFRLVRQTEGGDEMLDGDMRRLNDSDGAYRTTCIEQARAAIAKAKGE